MSLTPRQWLLRFIRHESTAGGLLLGAGVLAILVANSAWAGAYQAWLHLPISVGWGQYAMTETVANWINDALMAVFFLLVSMEIKRERVQGQLADMDRALLPCIAALGGVMVPAILYTAFNHTDALALRGWAVPTATDIAFSLAVMRVLGHRVPLALQIFLTTLAVVDDLAAIVLIAIFYSSSLHWDMLALAGALVGVLLLLNRLRVHSALAYLAVGLPLWWVVHHSGIHATVAGVALGFCIPLRTLTPERTPLLLRMEHALHPWVAYGILPLFAFANAGLSLAGMGWGALSHPVTLGVVVGLMLGKPVGIVGATYAAMRFGGLRKPIGATARTLWAMGVLGGIGFTMSLFVSGLAFATPELQVASRLGILLGSCGAAMLGYAMFVRAPIAQPYKPN